MFWITARIVPNAGLRTTRSELTTASPSWIATRVPARMCELSSPFGPLTRTRSPTSTVTPEGITTGFLPTRDMSIPLPDLAHELAAEAGVAGLAVGHEPLRRRQQGGTQPAHDARDLVARDIHAASRRAHALEPGDDRRLVGGVLEIDPQHALAPIVDDLEIVDEALAQQHLGDLRLETRRRNVHLAVLGADRVSNPGD